MDEEPMLYLLQQPNGYWKIGDEDHWTVCHEVAGDTARLIAAAPELLAALREALDVMGDWGDDGDPAWAGRAREAVAKAEGRSE